MEGLAGVPSGASKRREGGSELQGVEGVEGGG